MIVMYAKDYVLLTSSFRFRFRFSCVYFKCSKEIAMREKIKRTMKRVKKRPMRETKRPKIINNKLRKESTKNRERKI